MKILYIVLCWVETVLLTELPFLPWWGWLTVIMTFWGLSIWFLPWYAGALVSLCILLYLIFSFIVFILKEGN